MLLLGVGGAAAALGYSFTNVQSVSFGEATYEQSGLTVESATPNGPGLNVNEIEVVITHAEPGNVDATIEVWLLDDTTEVTTGTAVESFTPGETTVTVELDTSVRESNYDSMDLRITEN